MNRTGYPQPATRSAALPGSHRAAYNGGLSGNVGRLAQAKALEDKETGPVSFGMLNRIIYVSAFLLIAATGMYAYASTFGDEISRAGHSVNKSALVISIGPDRMTVPANGIRFAHQRKNGNTEKLELYRHWPSLSGYKDTLKEEFNKTGDASDIIFLTLEPRTMSFDMSGRVETIYNRFFKGKADKQKFGLVRQPLDPEGGFIDEDLYYDPTNPYPYAARCVRDNSKITTPFCIRDIHIGKNMMLTYRFHRKFLPQWIEMEQALRSHAKSMITNL